MDLDEMLKPLLIDRIVHDTPDQAVKIIFFRNLDRYTLEIIHLTNSWEQMEEMTRNDST